jgi:hypothetical protein
MIPMGGVTLYESREAPPPASPGGTPPAAPVGRELPTPLEVAACGGHHITVGCSPHPAPKGHLQPRQILLQKLSRAIALSQFSDQNFSSPGNGLGPKRADPRSGAPLALFGNMSLPGKTPLPVLETLAHTCSKRHVARKSEGAPLRGPLFLVRGHFQSMRNFDPKIETVLCTAQFLEQNLSRLQMALGRGVRRAPDKPIAGPRRRPPRGVWGDFPTGVAEGVPSRGSGGRSLPTFGEYLRWLP